MDYASPIVGNEGTRRLLLGNEAVARGALEAGIQIATAYPGTPSSEIADTLSKVAREFGLYMEYSVNEKVAVEVAAGAAVCGARALVSMKHVGLNVAADTLMTLAYVGVKGGFVIVTADDPSAWSSQNEQDNRYYALLANIPCLEPSSPQDAKDMLLYGFSLSEQLELPVMLRLVTRVSHMRGVVTFGQIQEKKSCKVEFPKDPQRFVMVPANARVRHVVLLEKMSSALKISEKSDFNRIVGRGRIGVVTSGASFNYCMESLALLGMKASVLKLGIIHPLPARLISNFVRRHNPIIIVEELEPYLELQVKALSRAAYNIPLYGKFDSLLPRHGELSTRKVVSALSRILHKSPSIDFDKIDAEASKAEKLAPSRPPVLCPGCAHRAAFYALKVAAGNRAIYSTDIGCYALGAQPPLSIGDILICMGSSVGLAGGIGKVVDDPVIGVVGDSTFFHASIPGLINAVYNSHKFVCVVLDNQTTAMTSFQPHAGTGITGMGEQVKPILIENIAKACGVEFVRVVDPYDLKLAISTVREALQHPAPSVIIFRRLCSILDLQTKRRKGEKIPQYRVEESKCNRCMACIKLLACPAILVAEGKVFIEETLCVGCGICAQICPMHAIAKVGETN
ncbi:MAG: indolepyruvate ferredoxin oxidoreductase subunit alpha [Candidatus Bathyarchaeia archaeon]